MTGSVNAVSSQVTVASTTTLLAAARLVPTAPRFRLTIVNHGTTAVFVGPSGVTASTGQLLAGVAGQALTYQFTGALYGITASGTQVVSVMEEF
jgi:hypothetical protein